MSWKWNMDQSNVSVQVTCQDVINWQRPAKSNYYLLLSLTSKFNWMHYLNDVKINPSNDLYNCDENERYIHEHIFRLIRIHCYDFTHLDSQQWWITLFCNGDIVQNANNYNHEFVNTLHIKYSKIDHRHDENELQKSCGSSKFIMQDIW